MRQRYSCRGHPQTAVTLCTWYYTRMFLECEGCEVREAAIMSEKKMSSSRKHHLKSLMLSIAKGLLEEEEESARRRGSDTWMKTAPLCLCPGTCRSYKKFNKSDKEIDDLKIKVQDLMGKFKKPVLKKDKDLRDVGDWRKNIEDKSGMDGRKKMFEAEA
ncbi:hypothetical protein WMY93_012275 [Mugilogobius chulae]|uniref:Troponin I n=1 Tax=Mugilogobius chulae TaxID=88201 RepID=A0AAW0PF93_9GOBI